MGPDNLNYPSRWGHDSARTSSLDAKTAHQVKSAVLTSCHHRKTDQTKQTNKTHRDCDEPAPFFLNHQNQISDLASPNITEANIFSF